MAGAHRRPPPDMTPADNEPLGDALLTNGRAFAFSQAMRLLRRMVPKASDAGDGGAHESIRVRPKLSLAFPSADIDRIDAMEAEGGGGYRITANFLGLYGTASPLPTFYTEDLLAESSQDESVSRDFVDTLNQRIYSLFFQGWLKYRQYLQVNENVDPRHLERLYCLAGLGSETLRQAQDKDFSSLGLLRYIGLLSQYPRSAAGLATLLADALGGIPLRVVSCIARKASIPEPQRMRIGLSGSRLAWTATWARRSKIAWDSSASRSDRWTRPLSCALRRAKRATRRWRPSPPRTSPILWPTKWNWFWRRARPRPWHWAIRCGPCWG